MNPFAEKKILIIEDPQLGGLLAGIFRSVGYRDVRTVEYGNAWLEAAEEWRPDLIISNVLCPRENGIHFLERISLNPATLSTRFIVYTGCRDMSYPDYRKRALAAGASRYLEKGVTDIHQLLGEIAAVFREAEAEDRRGL